MKNKTRIITLLFFILVNTRYFWEGKLGIYAFPIFILLAIVFVVLIFALLSQVYYCIKEKLSNKNRICKIGLLTIILSLTYYKPFGLIDFEKFESENLLVAEEKELQTV